MWGYCAVVFVVLLAVSVALAVMRLVGLFSWLEIVLVNSGVKRFLCMVVWFGLFLVTYICVGLVFVRFAFVCFGGWFVGLLVYGWLVVGLWCIFALVLWLRWYCLRRVLLCDCLWVLVVWWFC